MNLWSLLKQVSYAGAADDDFVFLYINFCWHRLSFTHTHTYTHCFCVLFYAEDNERHWGAVERHFSGRVKENLFVLDFTKPRGTLDPAYPIVKQLLTKAGHLSQFVNFNTYAHDQPRDQRKSNTILQAVARQILQKCGVRLWWVTLPRSVPLPAVFVGVDVLYVHDHSTVSVLCL